MTERVTPITVWALLRDCSRTGAPIVLSRLARWAKPAGAPCVHVIAIRGGPLEPAFRRYASSVTVLEPAGVRSLPDGLAAALASAGHLGTGRALRALAWKRRLRRLPRPDVVLLHGAGGWPVLAAAPPDVPLVVHLHELEIGLDRSIPTEAQPGLLRRANKVLAVSEPVADLALARGAVDGQIEVVAGVIDPDGRANRAEGLRPFPSGGPVVGGCGQPSWRKGTDRFVALAQALMRQAPTTRAAWVGGEPSGAEAYARGSNLPVAWFPERADPWALLAAADVVVIPSREDPLPLVALEAGQHHLPVVASATGGLPALLGSGRGRTVPVHDLRGLVKTTRELLDDPHQRTELGEALAAHVLAEHTVEAVGPMWSELLRAAAELTPAGPRRHPD